MSFTRGLIMRPVRVRGDIQKALSTSSRKIRTLCQHPNINPFSKYKPNVSQGYETPSDTTFANNHYYIRARATSVRNNLYSMSLGWTYEGAAAPYFREADFHRYFATKVIPFMQANGQRLTADLVNETATSALFYLFMNDGYVANRAFDGQSGISRSVAAVDADRLAYCICIEDLDFYDGSAYHSIMGGNVGLVIFSTTGTFKAEIFTGSGHTIRHADSRDNDMFILPLGSLTLPMGEYVAVACAKVTEDGHDYYMPVYDDAAYPARFTLEVGGVENYGVRRVGVAESVSDIPTDFLRTTASKVYLTMRLTNNSGSTMTMVVGNNAKFTLVCRIEGTVVDQDGSHNIDRTITTASIYRPTVNQTLAVGASVDLVYELTNIWNLDASTQPTQMESGRITLSPTIKYGGTDAYPQTVGLIAITYGTT